MATSFFIPSEAICPSCGGDGEMPVSIPGGYFSTALGCWLPDEHWERCEVCNGEGWVERLDEIDEVEA